MTNKTYKGMINDLCDGCSNCTGYCFLKEFVFESHPSPRLLIQCKCVEMFKYEIGEKVNKDIGWSESFERWASEGYATLFDKYYSDEKSHKVIYKEIMNHAKKI